MLNNPDFKVHIALSLPTGPRGGSFQFIDALRKRFALTGRLADKADNANIILFSASQNIPEVIKLRLSLPRALFVHRIDGPIRLYNGKVDGRDNVIKTVNKIIADATIFQSEWSRKENYRLGYRSSPHEIVIPNAPDPNVFNDLNKKPFSRSRKTKLVSSSWSDNWKKGFKTYKWLDENLDFSKYTMTFIGNSPVKFKNIRHIRPLENIHLAHELSLHDIFIFASEFEACSNTLLEALHSGLPALVKDSSSNPEVLGKSGELFRHAEDIPRLIEVMVNKYESYQKRICVPSMDEVAARYDTFIQNLATRAIAGRYKPKSLNLFSRTILKSTLFRCRLQQGLLYQYRKLSREN